MHIAFIIHNQAGTGPYFKVLEQCAALVRYGQEVTLFCTSPSRRIGITTAKRDGVRVVEFPDLLFGPLRQGVDLWNAAHRIVYARKWRFDVVHAVDCRPNVIIPSLIVKHWQKIPLVLSWWDLFGGGGLASERSGKLYARTAGAVETWFEEYFRKYADAATAITEFLRERLVGMGFPHERVMVQHVGCDSSVPVLGKEEQREQLGFVSDVPVLCFIGTIYETDFAFLLEALERVRQQAEFRVVWIGNFPIPDDVCKAYSVHHTGKLPTMSDVYAWLSASDICLLPMKPNITNKARWHSKVSDYWNMARPVVTTPVSDFPAIMYAHDVGWLAEGETPRHYADAIVRAIHESHLWKQKGDNGKQYVQRELDVRVLAKQLVAWYRQWGAKG